MELRIHAARTTRDIDLAIRNPPSKKWDNTVCRGLLENAASVDLKDGFEFIIGAPTMDLDAAPYGGSRFPVEAQMAGRRFANFHLDVSAGDVLREPFEILEGNDWLGFAGIAKAKLPAISREEQFAEKLHAFARIPAIVARNASASVRGLQISIGLTTFYGGTSDELHNLVSSEANIWSAAASAAGPLFTGGRLTGHYRQAKAEFEEAKLQYQDTALNAFREVSDALISHRKFEDERVEQIEAVNAGRDAVATSTDRYKEGKASYYEVLEAQQQLFPAENALSRIEASRRLTVVQLYKALGGGWSLKDSDCSHQR